MQAYYPVRGMRDLLPDQAKYYKYVTDQMVMCIESFGFERIETPILEASDLFVKSIGLGTDIVEKEMYCFLDKGNKSLTLRPEGTASCMRAGLSRGAFFHQVARWYYLGPMFRRERPQKGRYRQFFQLGVEIFGLNDPHAEVELIQLTHKIFSALGISEKLKLKLNSIGDGRVRQAYSKALENFFFHTRGVSKESAVGQKVFQNPLRLLDSKDPDVQKLLIGMPELKDYLDAAEQTHFQTVLSGLEGAQIPYVIDQRLVRGLDYYNRTVFEWFDPAANTQSTICGGGRYDGLATQMGSALAVPAAGFAIGLDRLVELVMSSAPSWNPSIRVCIVRKDPVNWMACLQLAEQLRNAFPECAVLHYYQESTEKQIRLAKKNALDLILIPLDAQGDKIKCLNSGQSRWVLSTLDTCISPWLGRK